MTTLRRDAIKIVEAILIPAYSDNPQTGDAINYAKEQAAKIVDVLQHMFFLKTDEEQPAYGSHPEKNYGFDLEQSDPAWSILAEKPITEKAVNKQKAVLDLEALVDAQLARLPYNWSGEDEKEKEHFRKFIKEKRKLGQELETWVNWWMSDEWRVANPPWKLRTVKVKWLNAFQETEKPLRPEYQKFAIPQDDSIPNPKES